MRCRRCWAAVHGSSRRTPPPAPAQVLDYDNVQQTLMPLLSRAYALIFMVRPAPGGGWPAVLRPWAFPCRQHSVTNLCAQLACSLLPTPTPSSVRLHCIHPALAAGPLHDGHVREL